MKVPISENKYIKNIEINDRNIDIVFRKKKKIALLFISINDPYWPYLKQVIEDCRQNFLPHHKVDYFVWSDIPEKNSPEYDAKLASLLPEEELKQVVATTNVRPNNQFFSRETIQQSMDFLRDQENITITPVEPIQWPIPTLMRYHLFLQQEEKLKEYDYIFYLDADMRVVAKISDEILGNGLTAAPHPGYVLASRYIPPYEPNKDSTAYIHRLGQIALDEKGVERFLPFYAAGGFQGGKSKKFLEAMKVMKKNIDTDFNKNYTAIWNDESHWNKFLWNYKGKITFLDVSYIYPDSLIKEYYEPMWGRKVEPKIVTLTKPFSVSKQGAEQLNEFVGATPEQKIPCPKCADLLSAPGHKIIRIDVCQGSGKPHQVKMERL